MDGRSLFALLTGAAVVASAAVSVVATGSAQAAAAGSEQLLAPPGRCGPAADQLRLDRAAAEAAMLCLTNYARSQARLPPLSADALLDRAGQAKLEADLGCGQFSHDPCGAQWDAVFAAYLDGASGYQTGENLAWGTGTYGTPRQALSLWLHSPHHRANILSPSFRDLGVGYISERTFLGYRGVTLWSQEFGSRTSGR